MKKALNALGVFAIAGLAGCSTMAVAPPQSALAPADLSALTAGYQLIHFDLAECAVIKGSVTPDVAQLADRICGDAAQTQPTMEALAQAHGVTLPNALPEDMVGRYVALSYHQVSDPSRQFLRDQVCSHEDALAVFRDESRNGSNPDVVDDTRRMIPVVEGNLAALKQALGNE